MQRQKWLTICGLKGSVWLSLYLYIYTDAYSVEHLPSFHAVIMFSSCRGFIYNFFKPLQITYQKQNSCFRYFKINTDFQKPRQNPGAEASLKTWTLSFRHLKQSFTWKYVVYRELNITFRLCEGQHKHSMVSQDTPFIYDKSAKSKSVSVIHTHTSS